jgi:uracil-DNA glycosylase
LSARDLLLEIAHCPVARGCLADPESAHPCARIVLSQGTIDPGEHHLPEPWDGDLAHAPLLFIGSNPSIDADELNPTWTWPDDDVLDFYTHRFDGQRGEWTRDARYPLLKDGTHRRRGVSFWAAVRRRAAELLEREPQPGIDYAMCGVVRCKSKAESGVREALDACAARYLERMLTASGARVIVGLGKIAGDALRRQYSIPEDAHLHGPVMIGRRERVVAFLPHPNARVRRSFAACLTSEELAHLRDLVRVTSLQ